MSRTKQTARKQTGGRPPKSSRDGIKKVLDTRDNDIDETVKDGSKRVQLNKGVVHGQSGLAVQSQGEEKSSEGEEGTGDYRSDANDGTASSTTIETPEPPSYKTFNLNSGPLSISLKGGQKNKMDDVVLKAQVQQLGSGSYGWKASKAYVPVKLKNGLTVHANVNIVVSVHHSDLSKSASPSTSPSEKKKKRKSSDNVDEPARSSQSPANKTTSKRAKRTIEDQTAPSTTPVVGSMRNSDSHSQNSRNADDFASPSDAPSDTGSLRYDETFGQRLLQKRADTAILPSDSISQTGCASE